MERIPLKINIKLTTATELCQIEKGETDGINKVSKIILKDQKVIATNSKGVEVPFKTPIFSGNSFRGTLRRASLEILLEEGLKKGFEIKNSADFNLMNAGGGNDYQTQLFRTEDEVRRVNPLISVFGASLAVGGKLITPNCIPFKNVEDDEKEYYAAEREDGSMYSTIKFDDAFHKCDDILDRKGNALFLTEEQIDEWQEHVLKNKAAKAKSRDNDSDNKIKKQTIEARIVREFIVRGTNLYTALSEMPTAKMSFIERGLIYKAIERMVLLKLGSNKARGFGLINYTIKYQDGSELETRVDEYLNPKITKKYYKQEVLEDIKAFEDWIVNDFSEDAFKVSEIMVQKK